MAACQSADLRVCVELRGFEPLTPSMRTRCATGLRYSPENLSQPSKPGGLPAPRITAARLDGQGTNSRHGPLSGTGPYDMDAALRVLEQHERAMGAFPMEGARW